MNPALNSAFSDPAFWHRLQFAFTVTYRYRRFPEAKGNNRSISPSRS